MPRLASSQAALLASLLAACGQAGDVGRPGTAAPPARSAAAASDRMVATPTRDRPGSFTVLSRGKVALGAAAPAQDVPRGTAAAPVRLDERLGVPTLLWAPPGAAVGAVATARASAGVRPRTPVEAARAHLSGAAAAYRLGARDTAAAAVAAVHDTGRGPIIVTFKQRPGGVEVYGGAASVLMARDLSLVAIAGALAPADASAQLLAGGAWSLDAREALAAALADVTGEAFAAADFAAVATRPGAVPAYDLLPAVAEARGERLREPATVERTWFRLPAGLQPAWRVELDLQRLGAAERLAYGSVVSASDGALLVRQDRQVHAAYGYRVWASDVAPFLPDDGPQGLAGTPHPTGVADGYQPPVAPRKLVTLESLPGVTDPWLPPDATSTWGNNVIAYADRATPDHFDLGDLMGTISDVGFFDWAWDPALAPGASDAQIQAAITQAFYVTNALHDWFYLAGYDEAAGNTQNDNFGRGGLQLDPLKVEVQDSAGLDNATTFIKPDGTSPWLEMYLWTNGERVQVDVNAPASVAGVRGAQGGSFGPQTFALRGTLVAATPAGACTAITNGSALQGKIALIDRGTCNFTVKVKNAQLAQAAGVIIRNTLAGEAFGPMGGTDATVTIPSVLVGLADGQALGTAAAAVAGGGEPVDLTLQRTAGTPRDGALDSLLLAHEWGHVLTNRLVHDATGLASITSGAFQAGQSAGMGEGWGDFVALLLAVREEDALVAANAGWAGTYATAGWVNGGLDVLGQPTQGYYRGYRRTPYSTDTSKAPLTFRHITDGVALPAASPPLVPNGAPNAEVHNAGEVWATVLWECYAALLRDTQGPTPRLTFDEASLRMREYLVASLRMLPQYPTFLDARDAMLAVARAGDPSLADFHLFWAAFAKRGMGVGAVAPDRFSATNAGVVESFVAGGQLAFVDARLEAVTSGCDDQDGVLDDGERGTLAITLRNHGAADLPAGLATITSSNPAVTFADGGRVTLAPTAVDGTSVATALVSAAGAGAFGAAQLTITFPDGYLAQPQPVVFPLRTGVDFQRAASATDDLESDRFLWTPGALRSPFAGDRFERLALDPTHHVIRGPNPESEADLTLTSPSLPVGAGALSVSWLHRFGFEAFAPEFYDGGVVELSDDDGASWRDVGGAAYPGALTVTGFGNPLQGSAAFVGSNPSGATYDRVTLDLTSACAGGSACAGKTVKLRFRIGSDQNTAGPVGWLIDEVAFTGLSATPFDVVVADARRCVDRPPVARAGADRVVAPATAVTLDATASSDPDAGTVLGFAWLQVSGPGVALAGADTATPGFTSPAVSGSVDLTFEVTVSDGQAAATDRVTVTVTSGNLPPVADAGPAQAVAAGAQVTLDASASTDPDAGTTLSYAWIQVSGPTVVLAGADTAAPTFQAPGQSAALVFQVTVGDGQASDAAQVTVTVSAPPPAGGGGGGGGCGCAAGGGDPAGLVPLLLGLAWLRRRRPAAAR